VSSPPDVPLVFSEKTKYPVYGLWPYSKEVVRFFAPKVGVSVNGKNWPIGTLKRNWMRTGWMRHSPTSEEEAAECNCKKRNCNSCIPNAQGNA
jgi:hypothetical protein